MRTNANDHIPQISLNIVNLAQRLAAAVLAVPGISAELTKLAEDTKKSVEESLADLTTYAPEVELARQRISNDDETQIDEGPLLSVGDDCLWVQAWLYVEITPERQKQLDIPTEADGLDVSGR